LTRHRERWHTFVMHRLTLPLLLLVSALSAAVPEHVSLDTGLIAGVSGSSPDMRIFKGIPFAAPPAGALRWRPPQPPAKWENVRAADKFGPRCMQGGGQGKGKALANDISEDCLYLNVWTPAKSAIERLPVALWIYGGAFTSGSGSEPRYDGEALAKKGIVVVTFNYRLGMFGFFAHPELTKESGRNASGNYGLMDTVAALRWIQRNIAVFGGDPRKVTIMGESAGANLVSAVTGSPEAKGLFHRAVAQSGAWMGLSMGKMTTLDRAEEAGVKLAASMNASSLAELRAKSAEEILRNGRPGGIVVDGWYIPEDLSLTYAKGKQNDVDVLVGSNKDEGTFFGGPASNAEQWSSQARERYGDQSGAFLKLYPAATDAQANESRLANFRDQVGWVMRTWAQFTAKKGKKAYVFYFTHEPPTAPGQPSRGATHTAELPYMFNNLTPGRTWTDADRTLAEQMSSYWVNFVATGDPNGKGLPKWEPFSTRNPRVIVLGEKFEPAPDAARIAFYDAQYAKQEASR
jgi:para-nitrobenzyl esterase